MAFEDEFLDMMPHTVWVAPYTGHDADNIATYGADVPYRCRIAGNIAALRTAQSELSTVIFTIWMAAAGATITIRDRLTLPDDPTYINRYPTIFTVDRLSDEDGSHHVRIQCGWAYHRQGA